MVDQVETQQLLKKAMALSKTSLSVESGLNEPFTRVKYPDALDRTKLQFPESLISIYHHPAYAALDWDARWELSRLKTINFFSVNIHGERRLIQGLEERLYSSARIGSSFEVGDYLQHFIHEENAHTHMMAGYCFRFGDGVMRDNGMSIIHPPLSLVGEELLFFGRVFVLETFLDYLNSKAMRDKTIDETSRQIHEYHHFEEARHIAFDRETIRACVDKLRTADNQNDLPLIREALKAYCESAIASLYVPKIYKTVGIERPVEVAREIRQNPARISVEQEWVAVTSEFLSEFDLW